MVLGEKQERHPAAGWLRATDSRVSIPHVVDVIDTAYAKSTGCLADHLRAVKVTRVVSAINS